MTLYTTQSPDGSSGLICFLGEWVLETDCSKQGKSQGTEMEVGWGRQEDFYYSLQESFHPWENMIQAMLPRSEGAGDRKVLRESCWGSLGWPREQHFLIHLIPHELKTSFHTSTHWKTFHLESTCFSLSDHSNWWSFLKRILHFKHFYSVKISTNKNYWTKCSWQVSQWPPHKEINAKLKLNKQ